MQNTTGMQRYYRAKPHDSKNVEVAPSIQVKRLSTHSFFVRLNNQPLCIADSSSGMFWDLDNTQPAFLANDIKERIICIIDAFKSL